MKASLHLQIGQNLTMTPQLQQAIKLLQMSTLDLQQEIQENLEANPLLEVEDAEPTSEEKKESKESDDSLDFEQGEQLPEDLAIDTRWDDIYIGNSSSGSSSSGSDYSDIDMLDQRNSITETLVDHLQWQLNLTNLSERDMAIGIVVIDDLNNEGFLQSSIEELIEACEHTLDIDEKAKLQDPELEVEADEVEAVIRTIHNFDPIGVGARNLQECLSIQLNHIFNGSATHEAAQILLSDHIDLLASADIKAIAKTSKLSTLEVEEALNVIKHFDPKPGLQITPAETDYVVPDVVVKKEKDQWVIELNQDTLPKLRINNGYASMIKRADNSADNTFLKNHLQEAKWFIKSLQSRNETLLKVATTIVDYQRGFFEYGDEAMKPMVLHDVATAVDMHESTISRVTTQKYMLTPHGIFELKHFFSSHVGTSVGGECSSTAIRALIKKLVAAENPKKPLSDAKMATLLQEQGIEVARRTVAKYRESLNIPSSSERKRLL